MICEIHNDGAGGCRRHSAANLEIILGFGLDKWRERWKSVVSHLASLARVACVFPGGACCSWEL